MPTFSWRFLSIFLISTFGNGNAFAQEATTPASANCVKYVYADVKEVRTHLVPVYACRNIVNNQAEDCQKIGSIDMQRLEQTKQRALDKMQMYFQGVASGLLCQAGVAMAPLLMRPTGVGGTVSSATGLDRVETKDQIARRAMQNVLNGTRVPGTLPNPDEVIPTRLTTMCRTWKREVNGNTAPSKIDDRDAFNMGVEAVLSHFTQAPAANAVLRGDRAALDQLFPRAGPERDAAIEAFQNRIREEQQKQKALLDQVTARANEFYRFMTDSSISGIPFGTSRQGISNDLKCLQDPERLKTMRAKLCQLAKTTAKIEEFRPGDLFGHRLPNADRVLDNIEERTRQWIRENCPNDVVSVPDIIEKTEYPLP